jgi:hypothetical protein
MIYKGSLKQYATTYLKQKENNHVWWTTATITLHQSIPHLCWVHETFNCVFTDPKLPRTTIQLGCSHDASICLFADSSHSRFWSIHLRWIFQNRIKVICGLLTMICNCQQQTVEYSFSHLFSELKGSVVLVPGCRKGRPRPDTYTCTSFPTTTHAAPSALRRSSSNCHSEMEGREGE